MRIRLPLCVMFALVVAGCSNPGPVVVITASCPGANAQVVADTVASPIEQQVNGAEKMARLVSESRCDGTYVARVQFQAGTNPDLAQVLVLNRVGLAHDVLSADVQRSVHVEIERKEKGSERPTIAIVDRGKPDRDLLRQLSVAVLKRLTADAAMVNPEMIPGPDENQVSVQIDRAKCAEHGISIVEAMKAIQAADADASIDALRAVEVPKANGEKVLLGDVAALELVVGPTAVCRVDMYPAMKITGVPPAGISAASAARKCVKLADEERMKMKESGDFQVLDVTGCY